MTLANGHHTQTRRNARKSFDVSHASSTPKQKLYVIIFDRGRRYSQVRFPAMHKLLVNIASHGLLPATRLTSRKITIEQNIKQQTGPAFCVQDYN
jgi:hypothetical protein